MKNDPMESRCVKYFRQVDKGILILVSIFVLTAFFLLTPWIYSDGVGEYAWVRSLFMDGDLDCSNEFAYYTSEFQRRFGWEDAGYDLAPIKTPTGLQANKYPIGTALLWSPFFVVGHFMTVLCNKLGLEYDADGYSRFYVLLVSFGSCFYAFIGLLLGYKISRFYFSRNVALLATLTIWFASSIPVYMYLYPSLPHSTSMFVVSLFIYFWWRTRWMRNAKQWALLGAIGGLMSMVRLENVVFFVLPAAEIVYRLYQHLKDKEWHKIRSYAGKAVLFCGCSLLIFSPQVIVWKIVFGKFFVNPYTATEVLKITSQRFEYVYEDPYTKPDSSTGVVSILIFFSHPHLIRTFFGSGHGLFTWTPIILFAILGYIQLFRSDRNIAIFLILAFISISYVVSCVGGAGASFGHRYLMKCGLIYILGLASLLQFCYKRIKFSVLITICSFFIIWNGLFILQYSTGLVKREGPISWSTMLKNQFTRAPKRLVSVAKPFLTGRSSVYEKYKEQK